MRPIEVSKVHRWYKDIGKQLSDLHEMYERTNAPKVRVVAAASMIMMYADIEESLQVDSEVGLFSDLEHAEATAVAVALSLQEGARTLYAGEPTTNKMIPMYQAANQRVLESLRTFILVLMQQYEYNRIK